MKSHGPLLTQVSQNGLRPNVILVQVNHWTWRKRHLQLLLPSAQEIMIQYCLKRCEYMSACYELDTGSGYQG